MKHYLLTLEAIREKSEKIFSLALENKGLFSIDMKKVDELTKVFSDKLRNEWSGKSIPLHSRWRHLSGPAPVLYSTLEKKLSSHSNLDKLKSEIDLVVISVLLDAGAGSKWKFHFDGKDFTRSEGLAVASLDMFLNGCFSSDPENPLMADSKALEKLSQENFFNGFQVTADNPLTGTEARLELLHKLSERLRELNSGKDERISTTVLSGMNTDSLTVSKLFESLQNLITPCWSDRPQLNGLPLGDTWSYSPFGDGEKSLIPFHKLLQWLSYSLLETLERSEFKITGSEALTALPEYRNGGLLLDTDCIKLKQLPKESGFEVSDPEVIEWRALTLTIIDRILEKLQKEYGHSLSMGQFLESCTWKTGRELAFSKRPDGSPPLKLISDGTVF